MAELSAVHSASTNYPPQCTAPSDDAQAYTGIVDKKGYLSTASVDGAAPLAIGAYEVYNEGRGMHQPMHPPACTLVYRLEL